MYTQPVLNRSTDIMDGDRSFSSASNEDNEYVWDGFTHAEQLGATPDDDYYEDLELAARLGKTLLQKNQELDTQNYQLRCLNEEKNLEIVHLNKQLSWLRDVNESKTRMYEQLDVNCQELETANKKLRSDTREWKERVAKCMSICESQEDQTQTLKAELESLRKLNEEKHSKQKIRRRTIHGYLPPSDQEPDLQKLLETSVELSESVNEKQEEKDSAFGNDEEVTALHEIIGNLKAQQIMDQRMIAELRKELDSVMHENQTCCEKLQEERDMTLKLNRIIEEYDKFLFNQALVAESTPNISVDLTDNEINFSDPGDEDEIVETLSVNVTSKQSSECKSSNHSPALATRVPMSQYLQIANSTPVKVASADPSLRNGVEPVQKSQCAPNSYFNTKSEPKNVSLVQELDTQYKTLLGKYEMLLQSIESERDSSSAVETPHEASKSCEDSPSSTASSPQVSSDTSNLPRPGSADAVPEYKILFREIFNLINKAKA